MNRLFLSACLVAVLIGNSAHAGHDRGRDEGRSRGPRVILYEHANFEGDFLVLYPGDEIDSFSDHRFPGGGKLNDEVTSLRIEGGAVVSVYADAWFRGAGVRLNEDVRDLSFRPLPGPGSWNDRISSVRVERGFLRDRLRPEDADRTIIRIYQDLLGRDADAAGLRYYRSRMVDDGWTEQMVREHVRQSDEYRGDGVTRIVQRAYRDILGREPDASGMNQFRRQLLNEGWSEADLRDALMRSDEYRRQNGGRR